MALTYILFVIALLAMGYIAGLANKEIALQKKLRASENVIALDLNDSGNVEWNIKLEDGWTTKKYVVVKIETTDRLNKFIEEGVDPFDGTAQD